MDIAERYIRLAHGIDAHSEGFIDGYGGPAGWADRSPRPPAQLQAEAEALAQDVQALTDPLRRGWLSVQVRAMHTMTRMLAGEDIPYEQEVRLVYDIDPLETSVDALEEGLAEMEAAVPGSGPLPERLDAMREKVVVPTGDILRLAEPILSELKRRTQERYGLPAGEQFTIGLVSDKPWSGYNWPLGNLTSRIDINTDLPVLLPGLPDLLAHEGYPGHHTEHATKEAVLVRGRGWLEHSLQLINAPECVVSEGIATNALDLVMSREEADAWLTGELARMAGLNGQDVQAFLDVNRAKEKMKAISGTAALMLYRDHRPDDEVLAFLMRYNAVTEMRGRQSLRFIQNRLYRGYIFTYSVGYERVKAFTAAHGPEGFRRLLNEPLTPGALLPEA